MLLLLRERTPRALHVANSEGDIISTVLAFIPSPPRAGFAIGDIAIQYYSLCLLVGILAGTALALRQWARHGNDTEDLYDALICAIPAGIIGARLYHVITDYQLYFGSTATRGPWGILRIWEGGLGIWGAVAGGALAVVTVCRYKGISPLAMGDAMVPGLLLGQAIGRMGNYFNQELFGAPTQLSWGLEIYQRTQGVRTGGMLAVVHPTFLYEMLWNILGVILLLLADRWLHDRQGSLSALYVVFYCFGRFWIELMRIDVVNTIAGFRVNTWMSGFCFLLFCGLLVHLLRQKKNHCIEVTESNR